MLYIVFNNKNSLEDFNLGILTSNEHYTSKEIIEYIQIDGRKKGSLTKKTGTFKDIIINRTFRMIDKKNYKVQIDKIANWLEEIENNKLWFSDYPHKSFIVKTAQILSIMDDKENIINIDVEFVCEPFLKDTIEEYEEVVYNDVIQNYGDYESEPKIKLSLPSYEQNIQITIKDKTLIIKNVANEVIIDTSLFSALSKEKYIDTIGNFPTLQKGINKINWVGKINKIEIYKNIIYRG